MVKKLRPRQTHTLIIHGNHHLQMGGPVRQIKKPGHGNTKWWNKKIIKGLIPIKTKQSKKLTPGSKNLHKTTQLSHVTQFPTQEGNARCGSKELKFAIRRVGKRDVDSTPTNRWGVGMCHFEATPTNCHK